MLEPNQEDFLISRADPILITGAAGFIGTRVVKSLLDHGFHNLRCLVRPSGNKRKLEAALKRREAEKAQIIQGDLLSEEDCTAAVRDVSVIYHLAAAKEEKSFADCFRNSVVTTRNLLRASTKSKALRRFVNVSSFSVYTNQDKPDRKVLDETCAVDKQPEQCGDAYRFSKLKQDEIVAEYGKKFKIPYVLLRPGFVYGPGNEAILGRIGVDRFGIFFHLGGGNEIPFTYVDNCADAIVLAGLKRGVDGEVFNIVDDLRPTSRQFLKMYKRYVRPLRSIYLPHWMSFLLCYFWEKYSRWSGGQLAPTYNRKIWHAYWKKTEFTNQKIKSRLGWTQRISSYEAFERYFESCKAKTDDA